MDVLFFCIIQKAKFHILDGLQVNPIRNLPRSRSATSLSPMIVAIILKFAKWRSHWTHEELWLYSKLCISLIFFLDFRTWCEKIKNFLSSANWLAQVFNCDFEQSFYKVYSRRKIVNYFARRSSLAVWQGSEYASV